MAGKTGPSSSTSNSNGLIFCLDAANQKSYAGYPTSSYTYPPTSYRSTPFYDLSGNNNTFNVWVSNQFSPSTLDLPILANNYLTFNGGNQYGNTVSPNSFDLRSTRTWDALVYLASDWDTQVRGSGTLYIQGIGYDCQYAVSIMNTTGNVRKIKLTSSDYKLCPFDTYNECLNYYRENSVLSTTVLSPATWYHLCTVLDNQVLYLYINGTLDSSYTWNPRLLAKGGITDIMSYADNTGGPGFFRGRLSLMRMYNRALSATEVYQNYINIKSRTTS